MGYAILYDPSAIVPNKVIGYLTNIDEPSFSGKANTLINPNLSQVSNVPEYIYWKVVNGSVVPMTSRDKYLISVEGKSDLKKLVVGIWSDYVQKIPDVIERGLTKYATGTVKLYSEDSTLSFDFNLAIGRTQLFLIDGSNVRLSISKKGDFEIKKDQQSLTVKAMIDYKAI